MTTENHTADTTTLANTVERIRESLPAWTASFDILSMTDEHLDAVTARCAYRLHTKGYLSISDVKVAVSGDPVRWADEMAGSNNV